MPNTKPPFGGSTATAREALPNLNRGCGATEVVVLLCGVRSISLNLLSCLARIIR